MIGSSFFDGDGDSYSFGAPIEVAPPTPQELEARQRQCKENDEATAKLAEAIKALGLPKMREVLTRPGSRTLLVYKYKPANPYYIEVDSKDFDAAMARVSEFLGR